MQERRYVRIFLLISSLLVLYFMLQIFRPFLLPISLAAILVTLSYPAFDWTRKKLKGRRSGAALLTCMALTVIIIVPVVVLVFLLAGEVSAVYLQFQQKVESGELEGLLGVKNNPYLEPFLYWIEPYVDVDKIDFLGSFSDGLQQLSLFFLRYGTTMLSGFFNLITGFLIMLVTMFFLFRDGDNLAEELKTWTPFSGTYDQVLFKKFREVASATVVGTLLTAFAQGIVGGLVFWSLGISNALFWGFLIALFSLVPVVGTAVVWVPWVIYFLATGSIVRAIILTLLAVFFVGMIDNVLRPLFIEGKAKLHTLFVFFSIMGGIVYFGMIGMIFGPIIVAIGLTFFELFKIEFSGNLSKHEPL